MWLFNGVTVTKFPWQSGIILLPILLFRGSKRSQQEGLKTSQI